MSRLPLKEITNLWKVRDLVSGVEPQPPGGAALGIGGDGRRRGGGRARQGCRHRRLAAGTGPPRLRHIYHVGTLRTLILT